MAIRTVVTRGFGNGTFNGTIPLVTLRGYGSSFAISFDIDFRIEVRPTLQFDIEAGPTLDATLEVRPALNFDIDIAGS